MKGSLKKRLIIHTTLAMLIVLAAASFALCAGIRTSLEADFDSNLQSKAQSLAWITEIDERKIKMEVNLAQLETTLKDEMFVLFDSAGKRVINSTKMTEELAGRLKPKAGQSPVGTIEIAGGPWRYTTLQFEPRLEEDDDRGYKARPSLTMIFAKSAAPLNHQIDKLAWIIGGIVTSALLISAGVIAWVLGRGLMPLQTLAARIEAIGDEDLATRVDVEKSPSELRPVVDRLNELLARLEGAFAREKNFTADIAHELRTPLAGLTTALEVCASQQRSPEEYEHVVSRCLKVSRTMRLMVENLLMLARVDAKQVRAKGDRIEVSPLLLDAWRDFAGVAARRGIRVEWHSDDSLEVASDRGLLLVVLRNLFDNAARYAAENGSIGISASRQDREAVISVENSGSQVAAEDAEKVFDRFWRGDAARTSAGEHCGLGLALCKRIMSVLGGSITVATSNGGAFSVTVKLPAEGTGGVEPAMPEDELVEAGAG